MGCASALMIFDLLPFGDTPAPLSTEIEYYDEAPEPRPDIVLKYGPPPPDPPGRPEVESRSWIATEGAPRGNRVNNMTYYGGRYLTKPEGVPYCPGPWSPEDPSGVKNPYPTN